MKAQLSFVTASLMLVVITLHVQAAPAGTSVQVRLDGLTITMTLQKRSPLQSGDWPDEPISLTSQCVPVTDKTIHELLKEAHIFPDVEAFTVVYKLNPDVERLREITILRIAIPKVIGGPKLEAALASGFVVLLTVEKEKKERFNNSVQKVKSLVQEVSKLPTEKFQDSSRDAIVNSLKSTSAILSGMNQRIVQRFGRPISTEGLNQLLAEVEMLNAMLTSKTKAGATMVKSDQNRISTIEKDVRIKGKAFSEVAAGDAPDEPPGVVVIVKTLRAGSQIPNLRVYYVPEALRGDSDEEQRFGILSSPTNKKIPEADYCFWASVDPARTPVTNVLCLEVRKGASAVELTVVREP